MVGQSRVPGSARARSLRFRSQVLLAAVVGAIASCSPASGGGFLIDGSGGAFPGLPDGVSGATSCQPSMTPHPVFAREMFAGVVASPWDFYVWTTAADAQSLRVTKKLFAHEPDAGTAARVATLNSLSSVDSSEQMFLSSLRTTFHSGRLAWSQPWASRLAIPDPGGELIHVTLRPDAWVAVVEGDTVVVYDNTRAPASYVDSYAHPERIGAILLETSLRDCSAPGPNPWRGFLLGNESMVQEWSLGTPEILTRLQTDIQDLSQFLSNTRACPTAMDKATWIGNVPCRWTDTTSAAQRTVSGSPGGAAGTGGAGGTSSESGSGSEFAGAPSNAGGTGAASFGGMFDGAENLPNGTEEFAYVGTLATVNANYFPQPAQIEAIIETLQGDLFEPNSFIVTPGSP